MIPPTAIAIKRASVLGMALILSLSPVAMRASMGPLEQYLPDGGEDPPWKIRRDDGSLYLSNHDDPGALTYYYANADAGPGSRRVISTEVAMRHGGDGSAKAGLLYAYDPKANSYYLFVIEPGQKVSLIRRDANGFNPVIELQKSSISDGANKLSIEETNDGIELLVNGEKVTSIDNSSVGQGGVGIVAAGIIDARFANFSLESPKALGQSRPQPGSPGNLPTAVSRPAASKSRPASGGTQAPLRLRPIQIVDTSGPFGQVAAYSTVVPDGWKTEGGVVWNDANGCRRGPQLNWNANSPDLSWGVNFLPILSWSVSSIGTQIGCMNADIPDAESAAKLYGQVNPQANLRDISFKRVPELQPVMQMISKGLAQLPGARQWMDGGEMRATFTGTDGAPHAMRLLIVTMHTEMSYAPMGMQGGIRFGSVGLAIGVTTPPDFQGDEFPPEVVAVLQNMRSNPQWDQAVQDWWRQQNQAAAARSRQAAADSSAMLDQSMESFQRRTAMQDDGQRKALSGIWETQRYNDTSGNTVDLGMNYNYAWQLNDGSIVQTNDATFNPMQSFGETGTQLDRVE